MTTRPGRPRSSRPRVSAGPGRPASLPPPTPTTAPTTSDPGRKARRNTTRPGCDVRSPGSLPGATSPPGASPGGGQPGLSRGAAGCMALHARGEPPVNHGGEPWIAELLRPVSEKAPGQDRLVQAAEDRRAVGSGESGRLTEQPLDFHVEEVRPSRPSAAACLGQGGQARRPLGDRHLSRHPLGIEGACEPALQRLRPTVLNPGRDSIGQDGDLRRRASRFTHDPSDLPHGDLTPRLTPCHNANCLRMRRNPTLQPRDDSPRVHTK